ncbi:MAG TPA: maleylpyruvate isomerase family mycothiol-dependent enzyme [Acidimicrobiales bacterium]|nr:maleylpyruvate isomerase family mycothiol-dependent enzyme [Acidimicrobiales bacterium]
METDPHRWIHALRVSHDALLAQVADLTPAQLQQGSYCRDWDVAQVLSHLGSGAEIALVGLERVLGHREPLNREEFPLIWDRWNALAPEGKATEMVVWDRRHVSVLQALDDKTLKSLRMNLFGMDLDAVHIVGLRLGEHAVHSWDVAVSFNPAAEVLPSSVELLVDRIPYIAGRLAKPEKASAKTQIKIKTSHPDRQFLLSIGDGVALSKDVEGPVDGYLELTSAALLRLVYGRLDPVHTPPGTNTKGSANLDELREIFAGF